MLDASVNWPGGTEVFVESTGANESIGVGILKMWPFTDDAAERYGQIAAHHRRAGRTIQQIDIQLAAIALTLGNTTVVTTDSDLAVVPGLAVENWAAP